MSSKDANSAPVQCSTNLQHKLLQTLVFSGAVQGLALIALCEDSQCSFWIFQHRLGDAAKSKQPMGAEACCRRPFFGSCSICRRWALVSSPASRDRFFSGIQASGDGDCARCGISPQPDPRQGRRSAGQFSGRHMYSSGQCRPCSHGQPEMTQTPHASWLSLAR